VPLATTGANPIKLFRVIYASFCELDCALFSTPNKTIKKEFVNVLQNFFAG
jgi:hypothetical protein